MKAAFSAALRAARLLSSQHFGSPHTPVINTGAIHVRS